MATMKIEIVAGGNTYTRTKTISAPDLIRLLNWFRAETANLSATDVQIAAALSDYMLARLRERVLAYERSAAVTAAQAGVTDLAFT